MIVKSYIYFFISLFLLFTNLIFPQDDKSKSLTEKPTKIVEYVTDETGTLTSSEINSLSQKLREFDKQTSTQIVVYMISSLGGESLEDVSHTIAEKNKIGRKGKDNGVLLFIAKNDRKMRIEVGYGLEGVLTDAISSQIIRNEIAPSFKKNNFYEGINKGIDAIISVTKGEYTADKNSDDFTAISCLGIPIFVLMIFGIIFFSIFISIIRNIFGLGRKVYSGGSKSGWSNWGGGGFFGGGGSSFGGGGFSGGGGSFGGGGASGSW